ncbi:MAG TPA: hypothetical protein ENK25_09135 [Bacteroidetes bacterium]|nr:hypothetical protein [Bacteroidota bacterium]
MKTKISDLTINETINYLQEIGDKKNVEPLESLVQEDPSLANLKISEVKETIHLSRATWRGTEHTFGYIRPGEKKGLHPILYAGSIEPDISLKNARVDILLAGIYTMNYPGWGRHNILLQFYTQHGTDAKGKPVKVQFQQKYVSKENEGAGVLGNFIFTGLKVPPSGLDFEVNVINLSNEEDEAALTVLDSEVIRKGLDLAHTALSGLETISRLGEGIVKLVLTRNRNKIVQSFHLGLNLTHVQGPLARLREGTFLAIQCRRDQLDWSDWVYDAHKGLVVLQQDTSVRLPYNHILFTVIKHKED